MKSVPNHQPVSQINWWWFSHFSLLIRSILDVSVVDEPFYTLYHQTCIYFVIEHMALQSYNPVKKKHVSTTIILKAPLSLWIVDPMAKSHQNHPCLASQTIVLIIIDRSHQNPHQNPQKPEFSQGCSSFLHETPIQGWNALSWNAQHQPDRRPDAEAPRLVIGSDLRVAHLAQ